MNKLVSALFVAALATGLASFAWDDDYLCLYIISAEQTAFQFIHASTAAQFHKNGFSSRFYGV